MLSSRRVLLFRVVGNGGPHMMTRRGEEEMMRVSGVYLRKLLSGDSTQNEQGGKGGGGKKTGMPPSTGADGTTPQTIPRGKRAEGQRGKLQGAIRLRPSEGIPTSPQPPSPPQPPPPQQPERGMRVTSPIPGQTSRAAPKQQHPTERFPGGGEASPLQQLQAIQAIPHLNLVLRPVTTSFQTSTAPVITAQNVLDGLVNAGVNPIAVKSLKISPGLINKLENTDVNFVHNMLVSFDKEDEVNKLKVKGNVDIGSVTYKVRIPPMPRTPATPSSTSSVEGSSPPPSIPIAQDLKSTVDHLKESAAFKFGTKPTVAPTVPSLSNLANIHADGERLAINHKVLGSHHRPRPIEQATRREQPQDTTMTKPTTTTPITPPPTTTTTTRPTMAAATRPIDPPRNIIQTPTTRSPPLPFVRRFEEKPKKLVVTGTEFHCMNGFFLSRFTSSAGKLMPRRLTGLSATQQRKLGREIRRARDLGLLPIMQKYLPTFDMAVTGQRSPNPLAPVFKGPVYDEFAVFMRDDASQKALTSKKSALRVDRKAMVEATEKLMTQQMEKWKMVRGKSMQRNNAKPSQ